MSETGLPQGLPTGVLINGEELKGSKQGQLPTAEDFKAAIDKAANA